MTFYGGSEISSIVEACRGMESDKISERRKSGENLQTLLANQSYIAVIDGNTDNGLGFTWDDVFQAVKTYMTKEIDKFKKDETKASHTSKSTREHHLQLSANYIINVIVLASERKPRLDVDTILHHCLTTLKDPFTFERFGRDYLTALNHEILSRRGYWSKVKPNTWLSLFLISLKLMKNPLPPSITYLSLASLLNSVMHHGIVQSDISLKVRKKLQFFVDSLSNKAMLQKEHHLVSIWIDSSIQLAFSIGFEDRLPLCSLTETTLNTFLDLCHDHLEDIDMIVRYSIIAMIAHHPNGVEMSEAGYMVAGNQEEWIRTLRRLHSLVDFIIKTNTQRNKTAEVKVLELEKNTVMLAVKVARQIFSNPELSMDVTRMGVMDQTSTSETSGPSAKKKRLMSGLTELAERLRSMGVTSDSIPLLQIATHLVATYPDFPQTHEMKEFLEFVVDITHDCRQYDMMSHCFKLFRIVCASIFERRQDSKELVQSTLQLDNITKLWDSVWKCVIAHQCHQESFLLMATLLYYKLGTVSMGRQLVQLLARPGDSVSCDRYSMLSLAAFLHRYTLHEQSFVRAIEKKEKDSSGLNWNSDPVGDRSIRSMVTEWLLGCQDRELLYAADLRFHLLTALAMKQPTVQHIEFTSHLFHLEAPTQFENDCKRLESRFFYIEILNQADVNQKTNVPRPITSSCMSATVLEEQLCSTKDLGVRILLNLGKFSKIEIELHPILDDAVSFLSLVRSIFLSGLFPDTIQLRNTATQLVTSILKFALNEESIYSKRYLREITDVFNLKSTLRAHEDFLRLTVWELCYKKLERTLPSHQLKDDVFGEVRRGGVSHPSVRLVTVVKEEKVSSLFSDSLLTEQEAWKVEIYRLLSTISSPTDPLEADRTEYHTMKSDLIRALTDSGIDPTSNAYLQIGFCLVRAYCQAPVLDVILVTDLVDLLSCLALQFGHDYEAGCAVLEVLPRIVNHVSNVGSPSTKAKVISVFLHFQNGIQDELFGPPVEDAFYRCLTSLPTTVDWLTWGAGTQTSGGIKPICFEALAGLSRPFNSTAITTSETVYQLFVGDTCWQDTLLETISSATVTKCFQLEFERDRDIRSAAIIQMLFSIMVKSPWAEKPALNIMLRFCKYKVDLDLIKRALELVARQLNVDCQIWLESRLEFLLDRWLDTETIGDFPYQLYLCLNLANFIEKYQQFVIPTVFLKKSEEDFIHLAQVTKKEGKDLLRQNIYATLAKILPLLSEAKLQQTEVPVTLNRFAQTKYKEMQHILVDRTLISQTIKNDLLGLLTRLLLTVYDPAVTSQLFGPGIVLPLIGSFRSERLPILEAIKYLSPETIADSTIQPFENLILWAGTCPWEVHTLLVNLFVAYETGCRLTDKQEALVTISVASGLLINALEENQQTVLFYVFHSLIQRMGHIIRREDSDEILRRGAMVIVKEVLNKVIKRFPDFISQLIVTVVGFVTPLAKSSGGLQWIAVDILDFLIVEQRIQLQSAIEKLSPFPDLPQFNHLNRALEENKRIRHRTLVEEMGLFLKLVEELGQDNVPVESIENLARMLGNRKEELVKLYTQLQAVDISSTEQTSCTPRHLASCLIQLAKSKPFLSEAVATALGKLGPADLNTLVLHPDTHVPDATTEQGQMEIHAQSHFILQLSVAVFPLLVRYLFADENVQLLTQSGGVMLKAMDSIEGQQFGLLAKKYDWPSRRLLAPFRIKTTGEQKNLFVDMNFFNNNIDDTTLWTPSKAGHSLWLIRLTCTLISAFNPPNFFSTLLPICRLQAEFCSTVLPFVIRTMLKNGEQRIRDVISMHINDVLSKPANMAEPFVKTLLQVIQFLRSQDRDRKTDTHWDRNFRLNLNYLEAARAARSCSAYFSTIMYTEIWLDRLNTTGHSEPLLDAGDSGFRKMDQVQDLLFEAYTCTGEPDGRTGFQFLPDIRLYEQESDWFRALEFYDAQASYGDSEDQLGLSFSALSRCGLYRTLYDASSSHENPSFKEYQYECAWRLADWDLHQERDAGETPGFHQLLFNSLVALKRGNKTEITDNLCKSRILVIDQLRQAGSLESCRIIYPALSLLRLVCEVESASQADLKVATLKESWTRDDLPVNDFMFLEPSLALRAVILKEFLPRTAETTSALVTTLLETCKKARQYGNYTAAGRCLAQLSSLPDLNQDLKFEFRLEKALTEWQRKDGGRACNTLRSLASALQRDSPSHPIYPRVLSLLGQWLHESRSENPRQILSLYFRKSLDAATTCQTRSKWSGSEAKESPLSYGVSDARQVLARYADSLYNDLQSYIESRDFETQQKLAKVRQGMAAELKKMKASAPEEKRDEVRRANLFMTNETTNDMSEFETLFKERELYLLEAVENYLVGIREETGRSNQNSSFDVRISRLISLWFDNRSNVNLTELMIKWLAKISSYHFIPVLPQLAARLVSKPNPQLYHDEFPKLLQNLLEKCALEHPHHTLPVILALAMTNKDREIQNPRSASQQPEEDRVTAANKLIAKVSKRSESGAHCKKLEQLHLSLIKLANKEVNVRERNQDDALKLPAELSSMKNLEDVAIPTVALPVNPDGIYRNDQIVGIVSFEPHFVLVGGINAPKKMACLGTDGKTRPMLLKGKDDLRQDAVMQQVFSTMNLFLEQEESTRQRKLNIRKYKVVPLSRRSGLLEWCEGTNPIGLYLMGKDGKSGAHLRYARPGEMTTEDTRKEMANLMNIKSADERFRRFTEICNRFPPVFRHFFLERYTLPSLWFEKRLTYTRSAAASSMVGYILGLGDRHLHNILIDEHTAELIHIDLGIAFDQGTVLPTPETVPFRLTRDIVDAMGVMGVEGVFRRCCEFTMEVMRKQQDSILTLLEVLLYDPLYVWTVTPQKAAAVQKRGLSKRRDSTVGEEETVDVEVNESAKRTLVRLSQKLRGVEKGTPLSVQGQVNLLIQQATDPVNLHRIYHGWKPQA